MVIKAVLFDLDQTLLDRTISLKKFLNWQINFFELVPLDLKAEFIQRFLALDANGSVWKDYVYSQLIQEFEITGHRTEALLEIYVRDFNKFATPFDGVENTIQELYRQGFKLGLISNGKSPFQEHNFNSLGLQKYFSSIIVSEKVGLRKPDPKIFYLACEQLDVNLKEAIFVGDNWSVDIEGARNAGLNTLYFQNLQFENDLELTETLMVHDFKTLLDMILEF